MTRRLAQFARLAYLFLPLAWCSPLTAQEGAAAEPPATTAREPAPAPTTTPDRIVLKNGDVITGTIKTMGDGKLTLEHPVLGDIEIQFDDIESIVTGEAVTLKTKGGEVLKRRVTGIEGGALILGGAEPGQPIIGNVPRSELAAINPPLEKPAEWTGSVAIGANISTGNTDKRSANMTGEASRRADNDRISAKGLWLYEENKDTGEWNLTDRILRGQLKYDYFLTEKFYAMTNASAGADDSAGIKLRFTMGAGFGYQWYETEEFKLFTEASVQYVNEQYANSAQDDDYVAGRLASGVDWQITKDLSFHNDVEYFPSLEDKDDIFVTMNTSARLALTESMFAQARWLLEYDNTPNSGDDRMDNKYFLQVGWAF